MTETVEVQQPAQPAQKKAQRSLFYKSSVLATGFVLAVTPAIGGAVLISLSTAPLALVVGSLAIAGSIYPVVRGIGVLLRAPRQKPLTDFVKMLKEKPSKLKAAFSLAANTATVAAGIGLFASIGAVSGPAAFGVGTVALYMTVMGSIAASINVIGFGIKSFFSSKSGQKALDAVLEEEKKELAAATAVQPSSKLDNAAAKTDFNTSADPAVKPEVAAEQKPVVPPQGPTA